ncbi:hypothetical protein NC651_040383 [Populus alba x Populus x berolinensis]|nr:hypothetical protein NC651_040383 [Populus alba x Populus x berolinensis]
MLLVILVLCNSVIWLTVIYQSVNNYGGGYTAPLPPGWEERSDAATGKTRRIILITTLELQPGIIHVQINLERDLTILSPLSPLALYTGSKAMHSQILNIFNEEAEKSEQFSVAQNLQITLQRRYKNVLVKMAFVRSSWKCFLGRDFSSIFHQFQFNL